MKTIHRWLVTLKPEMTRHSNNNGSFLSQSSQPTTLKRLVLCLWLNYLVIPASAEESQSTETSSVESKTEQNLPAEPKAEPEQSTLEWLRDTRNDWGEFIGNTGQRLDGFFAGNEAIENTNESFLKLALKATQSKNGHSELRPIIKFRLDLPALQKRLKLVFESEPAETQSLEELNRSRTSDQDEKVRDTAIGAVELKTKPSHRWNASTSVGTKIRLPIDTFWRTKGNYRWQISERWSLNLRESLYYFHLDGWGETTQLTFERDSDHYVFRSKLEAKYLHEQRKMEFAQVFSLLKELSPIRAISYQLGILGENKPEVQTTAYFVNTTYRRKLYSNWLFYEMTPELLFPRDESFKLSPSITAKIEIVFSSQQ